VVCNDYLILSSGETGAQILRMLPKLTGLRGKAHPLSIGALTAVSINLVSLECDSGFDFDTAQIDVSLLRFASLKEITVKSKEGSDLQWIVKVLENSIPQGRGFLKKLDIMRNSPTTFSASAQFPESLKRVIEVRHSSLMIKASPELEDLRIVFSSRSIVNLDSCLDAIIGLDQISILFLCWSRMSLDKFLVVLRKQRAKKRWNTLCLVGFDPAWTEADFLEICSFLPDLREFGGGEIPLAIEGVREWKRICPNLRMVRIIWGIRLTEEVKDELRGLGVTVEEIGLS
jgi:hypothetical protein